MTHCDFQIIYEHMVIKGIDPTYNFWYHVGEVCEGDEIENEVDDNFMCEATNFYERTYMGERTPFMTILHQERKKKFSKGGRGKYAFLYGDRTKYT